MIWNWASLTPPDRCRSSCAEMRLEGLATDWLWRRSLDDGGADQHKTKSTTKKEGGWLAQGSTENVFLQKIYFTHSPQWIKLLVWERKLKITRKNTWDFLLSLLSSWIDWLWFFSLILQLWQQRSVNSYWLLSNSILSLLSRHYIFLFISWTGPEKKNLVPRLSFQFSFTTK